MQIFHLLGVQTLFYQQYVKIIMYKNTKNALRNAHIEI